MWHQAGSVWYTKKIGSMKSAPAGRKTPLPPLHLAIHSTTRRLLPLLGPGRARGRGDAAMEWARELPTRVYYSLNPHRRRRRSSRLLAASSSSITLGWPTDVILALALAISHPPVGPPAQPPALHINAVRAWIYECEFPCQTKIKTLRPPTFHFLLGAHNAILIHFCFTTRFIPLPDIGMNLWIRACFFHLLFMTWNFCMANTFFRQRITILRSHSDFSIVNFIPFAHNPRGIFEVWFFHTSLAS